ncbi:hypothetical protein ES703_64316 [subsurface metagenome]
MLKKIEYKGLCSNCDNASTCTFPGYPERPVLQCEEYVCSPIPIIKNVDKERYQSTRSQVKSIINEEKLGKYKGLCVNCDFRKTCMYPKGEGGVWHCENYQ